jgi:DNA-binding NtrC family response regulator
MEKMMITNLLLQNDGNRGLTARSLGINTSTLYRKIQSLGIDVPEIDGRSHRKGIHRR